MFSIGTVLQKKAAAVRPPIRFKNIIEKTDEDFTHIPIG
jgi:hypothetical protein